MDCKFSNHAQSGRNISTCLGDDVNFLKLNSLMISSEQLNCNVILILPILKCFGTIYLISLSDDVYIKQWHIARTHKESHLTSAYDFC